jgi:hypothetical protein
MSGLKSRAFSRETEQTIFVRSIMFHGAAITSRHLHGLRRPPLRLTPPSTDLSHPASSLHHEDPGIDDAPPQAQTQREGARTFHPRMIFVRPWDGIPTISHAFAIVRGIERRFGKIQEFVVLRVRVSVFLNFYYMTDFECDDVGS